jgi:predicted RNase H-like HicB family nuclease
MIVLSKRKQPALRGFLDKGFSYYDSFRMKYQVTLIKSKEGWAVLCPSLPGCCSQGETKEEALQNIRVAIQEYLGNTGGNSHPPKSP